jgi:hypothetical protein
MLSLHPSIFLSKQKLGFRTLETGSAEFGSFLLLTVWKRSHFHKINEPFCLLHPNPGIPLTTLFPNTKGQACLPSGFDYSPRINRCQFG